MENKTNVRAFLNNATVKKGLNLTSISNALESIKKGETDLFNKSVKLGALIFSTCEWLKTVKAKELLKSNGLEWKQQDLIKRSFDLYGKEIKKAWFYRLQKVGKMDAKIKDAFLVACNKIDELKNSPNISIDELTKFENLVNYDAKKGVTKTLLNEAIDKYVKLFIDGKQEVEDVAEAVETETSEETETGEAVELEKGTKLMLNFKSKDGSNVVLRITDKGEIITTNSDSQINEAIDFIIERRMMKAKRNQAKKTLSKGGVKIK